MESCHLLGDQRHIREFLKRKVKAKIAEIDKLTGLAENEKYKKKMEVYREFGEQLLILDGVIKDKEISLK